MKFKISLYIILLLFFLFLGIYINFDLDKEFLSLSNFNQDILVISIIFFLGGKTLSELYFFSIKRWSFTKIATGLFALSLILCGVYASHVTRTYNAEQKYNKIEAQNQDINQKNQALSESKRRLQKELAGLNSQIKTIEEKISQTHFSYIGIIRSYRNDLKNFEKQKQPLLRQINKIDQQTIPLSKKKITLLHEHKSAIWLYLVYSIIVELMLILISHLIAPVLSLEHFLRKVSYRNISNRLQPDFQVICTKSSQANKDVKAALKLQSKQMKN